MGDLSAAEAGGCQDRPYLHRAVHECRPLASRSSRLRTCVAERFPKASDPSRPGAAGVSAAEARRSRGGIPVKGISLDWYE